MLKLTYDLLLVFDTGTASKTSGNVTIVTIYTMSLVFALMSLLVV